MHKRRAERQPYEGEEGEWRTAGMVRIGFLQALARGATGFLWGRQNYFLICIGAAVLAQRRRWRPRHRDLYAAHVFGAQGGRIGKTTLSFQLLPWETERGEICGRGRDAEDADDEVECQNSSSSMIAHRNRPLQPHFTI